MAHEVFISYATEDSSVADAVCKALEEGGVRCWYAPRDIPFAVDYEEAIVEAIIASKLLILILSTHSNNSPHVKREVQNACREEPQVPVLPFQVEDISLNKSLRYYLGSVQSLKALTLPLEPHLQRLVRYVQMRLSQHELEVRPEALDWQNAYTTINTSAEQAPPDSGGEQAKNALYQKFLDLYKKDPKAAYEVAKEYLQKYPAESTQTAYLKKWNAAYEAKEKNDRKAAVSEMLRAQKYAEAFNSAKAILATEPNDVDMLTSAAFAAFYAAGVQKNDSFNVEGANYARKAIQLMQAGQPFEKRDETLGYLHSIIGFFTLKTNPSEAVASYIKAAQFEGAVKKDPQTYLFLGDAYRAAEYTAPAAEFKTKCATAEQQATPECKALTDRLNAVMDRMIDAYARAAALATDPKFAPIKTDAMSALTPLYKYRHGDSDAGLPGYISGVLATPLPTGPLGTASAATAPTTQTTNTPATGSNVSTTTNATNNGTTTTPNTTGTQPKTTTPSTTTPATTTPAKTPRR